MNVIINGKPADVKAANLKELAAENAMVPRTEWESTYNLHGRKVRSEFAKLFRIHYFWKHYHLGA